MTDRTDDLTITDNPDVRRFDAHLDGELVGFMEYIPLVGKIIATHTEVSPEHEGKGYGSQLVRGVIAHLRSDGRLMQPMCPYVTSWLRRHPEEADVVDRSTQH